MAETLIAEAVDKLRRFLVDQPAARRAYAAIHTYTIGFAALEASRAGGSEATKSGNEPSHSNTGDLADQLAAYTTPRQFAEGLRYLLEGIDGVTDET